MSVFRAIPEGRRRTASAPHHAPEPVPIVSRPPAKRTESGPHGASPETVEPSHGESTTRRQLDVTGRLHSVESFGTLDGPGIRYVLFFQGCHLRCLYCQNRDTWSRDAGREVTVRELMEEIAPMRVFMDRSGGGITASGGDPILQAPFVAELFETARAAGIHTALDTSGVARITPAVERLLAATDLVLLDIKQIDPEIHQRLTGRSNQLVLAFAAHTAARGLPIWIRHVVLPGYTTGRESAERTAAFLTTVPTVERVELIPYHELGKHKWTAMGETYPLEGTAPPTAEELTEVADVFRGHGLPVAPPTW